MADRRPRVGGERLTRRALLSASAAALLLTALAPREARAAAAAVTFTPRLLRAGGVEADPLRRRGLVRWAAELEARTSVKPRALVEAVAATSPELLDEPFVVWTGAKAAHLTRAERVGLRRFFELGGLLLVDDEEPERHEFTDSVKAELLAVLPEAPPARLPASHVLFKSYYLLKRPRGRVAGPEFVEASTRGGMAQVLFLRHDLLGALADAPNGAAALPVEGGQEAREQAVRLAVNLALYALCSDYKDDQAHAAWLMRRRSRNAR